MFESDLRPQLTRYRRRIRPLQLAIGAAIVFLLSAGQLASQALPTQGRFALFTSWSQRDWGNGPNGDFTEVIAMLSVHSDEGGSSLFDFAVDARLATYPSVERDESVSLYEAWVGVHSTNRSWNLRLGQMWLHELGGLGSVGGFFGEYRQPTPSSWGRWRFGLFAGLELAPYELEYLSDIEKGGVYAALDGAHGRQHVLGYVRIRNQGLTERSVVVFNNFIPVGRAFTLYEALQYDTEGPAGIGDPELTYLFLNLRYRFSKAIDLQGTYHRGRSIDGRTITEEVLGGRPVSPEVLRGFFFESGRVRLAVRPARRISLWIGYGNDRSERDDPTAKRLNIGFSARRIFGTPMDFSLSSTATDRGDDSYDSHWASLGYSFGSKVYVSVEYRDTIAVYRVDQGNGDTVEIRPDSDFLSISSNINLNRTFSLLLEAGILDHRDFEENRVMTGLIIRF